MIETAPRGPLSTAPETGWVSPWDMSRRLRLEVSRRMPPEVRDAVDRDLPPLLTLLPGWVTDLLVTWDGEDNENALRVHAAVEYRRATIYVCAGWLGEVPAERRRIMLHELAHLPTVALADFARRLVDGLENPERKADLTETLRLLLEGATCDIAEMMLVAAAQGDTITARGV